MKNVMVCVSNDPQWTTEAVQQACILARDIRAEVVLVKMLRVQHLGWLGTELGYMDYHPGDLEYCVEIAEGYGVTLSIQPFQYYALADAIVEAAEYIKANIVFAILPKSPVNMWRKFQMWNMEHKLWERECLLYTLENHADPTEYIPVMHVVVPEK